MSPKIIEYFRFGGQGIYGYVKGFMIIFSNGSSAAPFLKLLGQLKLDCNNGLLKKQYQ